jgi:hypothetical protein
MTKKETLVDDLIAKAKTDETRPDLYCNFTQIVITNSEIFLDFYYLSPRQGKVVAQQSIDATRMQRVILPLSNAKGLATALANVIAQYEVDHDTVLANQRPTQEGDTITIWP